MLIVGGSEGRGVGPNCGRWLPRLATGTSWALFWLNLALVPELAEATSGEPTGVTPSAGTVPAGAAARPRAGSPRRPVRRKQSPLQPPPAHVATPPAAAPAPPPVADAGSSTSPTAAAPASPPSADSRVSAAPPAAPAAAPALPSGADPGASTPSPPAAPAATAAAAPPANAGSATPPQVTVVTAAPVRPPTSEPAAATPPSSTAASAAAPAGSQAEKPNIHGFFDVTFRSAYITPRGLVVNQDRGLVTQAIGAMVLPLYSGRTGLTGVALVIGGWSSIHTDQGHDKVGPWNEFDFFANLKLTFLNKLDIGAAYVVFTSPPGNFQSEHNIEFTLSFDDSSYLHGFGFRPYAKVFWAVAGDSTVVLGQKGGTLDVELGLTPTYILQLAKSARYPLSLSAPLWLTVGPESFWGTTQNLGVFVGSLSVSLGLGFIPGRFGSWHLVAGVNYYHLINDNLVAAATVLGNTDARSRVMGFGGFGFNY